MNSPSVSIGPYVVGEKPAPLLYRFTDENGVALDLSGYVARFTWRERYAARTTATTANAAVTSAANGEVTYTWSGTEFASAGSYLAELWVGNNVQRFASVYVRFVVRAPVGVVPNI